MTRPQPDDYTPFAARYVDLVPEGDLLNALRAQSGLTRAAFLAHAARPDFRYELENWSVAQMLGHMADTERVFGFRALWIARRDASPLPGFEQDDWMAASNFDLPLKTLLDGFEAARRSNLLMLEGLDPVAWTRRGAVGGHPFSVRALAYMLLGHERAHLDVLRERYSAG